MTLAYHFTGDTLRDGRPIPPIGEPLHHDGKIVICKSGLHASHHPFDALQYAPGPLLHLVRCEGIGAKQGDKLVCRTRTIIKSVDATHLLRRFAADQALSVAHLWDMPDVVSEYLTTLDESKKVAAYAAAGAAWAAAWAAADAAWAARYAAGAAAGAACAADAAWAARYAAYAADAARAACAADAARAARYAAYAARGEFKRRVDAAWEAAQ